MDLIYTNANHEDIGVLLDYELDLAFGKDENNFECKVQARSHCCEAGSLLYFEGAEYGGVVDCIESKTADKEVVYSGRTWHGILASKIIMPLQDGEESPVTDVTIKTEDSDGNSLVDKYLIISGDVNKCVRFVLDRCNLSSVFTVSEEESGVEVAEYQFHRYTDAYSGLMKMLASVDMTLKMQHQNGMVTLFLVARYDYSEDEEFDSDLVDFTSKKKHNAVNHLICLGSGELENRLVVHLYTDAEGNISRTQTFFGNDEYAEVYDYSSMESEEELITAGKERLHELYASDALEIDFDATEDVYNVGDIIGAYDNITGVSVSAEIVKKIVSVKDGHINISYEVGE